MFVLGFIGTYEVHYHARGDVVFEPSNLRVFPVVLSAKNPARLRFAHFFLSDVRTSAFYLPSIESGGGGLGGKARPGGCVALQS